MTVTFENISKVYSPHGGSARTIALDNVSLTLEEGQLIVLLGPSGCGKTTLLKLLGGFEQPTAGKVLVNGELVRQPGPDRGTIFQAPTLFPWLSTLDNVLYGPRVRGMHDFLRPSEGNPFAGNANSGYKTPEGRERVAQTLIAPDRDAKQKKTEAAEDCRQQETFLNFGQRRKHKPGEKKKQQWERDHYSGVKREMKRNHERVGNA